MISSPGIEGETPNQTLEGSFNVSPHATGSRRVVVPWHTVRNPGLRLCLEIALIIFSLITTAAEDEEVVIIILVTRISVCELMRRQSTNPYPAYSHTPHGFRF